MLYTATRSAAPAFTILLGCCPVVDVVVFNVVNIAGSLFICGCC